MQNLTEVVYKLYKLTISFDGFSRLPSEYYVIETDPTSAELKLKDIFSQKRIPIKVEKIKNIASNIYYTTVGVNEILDDDGNQIKVPYLYDPECRLLF